MDDARMMILGLILIGLARPTPVRGREPEGRVFFEKKNSEVVECRVSLDLSFDDTVHWRTTDVKSMKELFLDPLANAKPDPEPAEYEVLGSVTITRKDGSQAFFWVFDPWGRVKRENAYLIADLRELHRALKGALKDALQFVGETPQGGKVTEKRRTKSGRPHPNLRPPRQLQLRLGNPLRGLSVGQPNRLALRS